MNVIELLDIISSGETSKVQFKREIDNDDAIAAEIIAMSNSKGGKIIFGVEDKTGQIIGLNYEQIQNYSNKLANIANDRIKPQVFIRTEVVTVDNNKILIVEIDEGIAKPYKDRNGIIWVKQGADKRKLTDNHEQIRLFQHSGMMYLDEMPIPNTSSVDINIPKVLEYIKKLQNGSLENDIEINDVILRNLNILRDDKMTLAGLLFFAEDSQRYRPEFCIKAVHFFGNSIGGTDYRSSKDINGTLPELFEGGMSFLTSNLNSIQDGQNFNSVGKLEISEIALEEILQNALVHRDYSKNSPIRIMIFDNRIEIVSPGALPNSLTIENIKMGNAVVRNNIIVSYCSKLMKYRGFGSGITRIMENQPNVEFINDIEGEQFKVIIYREIT